MRSQGGGGRARQRRTDLPPEAAPPGAGKVWPYGVNTKAAACSYRVAGADLKVAATGLGRGSRRVPTPPARGRGRTAAQKKQLRENVWYGRGVEVRAHLLRHDTSPVGQYLGGVLHHH